MVTEIPVETDSAKNEKVGKFVYSRSVQTWDNVRFKPLRRRIAKTVETTAHFKNIWRNRESNTTERKHNRESNTIERTTQQNENQNMYIQHATVCN